jgi:phytoene synthase
MLPDPMLEPGKRVAVVEAARTHAFDFYLSALLAPRAARDDLIVLAAFEGELDRIPVGVSEPMLAEIRLQWWRDAVGGFAGGAVSGNPIADALAHVVARHGIDPADLVRSIDARSPVETEAEALGIVDAGRLRRLATDAAAMRRAARVLGCVPLAADDGAFLDAAGLAVASVRALVTKPSRESDATAIEANAEADLSGAALAQLGAAVALLPGRSRALRLSALPVALVRPYLRAWEKGRHATPPRHAVILPLERVWRLWWLARTGRV